MICFYFWRREAQDERPAAVGGGGAGALRRRGGQELRSSRRRCEANGLRGSGGLRIGRVGQELLQAQELRGPGIDDAGLPADDGGALADLQGPAAEDREAGEEEARPVGLGCFSGPKGAITPGHT